MILSKRITIFVIFLVSNSQIIAQPAGRTIVNQSAEWFSATANLKISKKLTLMIDGQFRYSEFEPAQFIARPALDIAINDHLSVAPIGYAYIWNSVYGKQPNVYGNNEHRIWQQVFVKHGIFNKLKVDHRLRLEERFIQRKENKTESYAENKQLRVRYRFMARLPLNSEKIDPKTFFASAYDEVFYSFSEAFGFGEYVTFHEPDQNRIFLGAGYQVNKSLSLQVGGFYQMLIKANGAKQENNVGCQLLATYNLNLMKAE
jgi:hypothetical protein